MSAFAIDSDGVASDAQPHESLLDLELMQASQANGDPLNLMQLRVLVAISDTGMQSVRALAARLDLPVPVIDRLCPPLVARGLMLRIPRGSTDASPAIILSTAGRRFVNNLRYRNVAALQQRRELDPVWPTA